MKPRTLAGLLFVCLSLADSSAADQTPSPLATSLLFPPEAWHNHGSCLVELPNGDLLACWFHGSGERTADDVVIQGARRPRGQAQWSERFQLADTPVFPDGNPCLFIDPEQRLWLIHTTILANTWESALLKAYVSRDYSQPGPPRWESQQVIHLKPGPEFAAAIARFLPELEQTVGTLPLSEAQRREANDFLSAMRERAGDKLYSRLGWMSRAHPVTVAGKRLLVPLYHDGFSFSLVAFSDDLGRTWQTSSPILGAGNIQPSVVQRKDGSLYTLMRDNGPPPKRLLEAESRDGGATWSVARDSVHPNPGSGAEIIRLASGTWALINNDTETGRYRLTVSLSEDEGRTWPWARSLEEDSAKVDRGSYHYPSITQAHDGTLHVVYSFHVPEKQPFGSTVTMKSIKHAQFTEAWIKAGLH